MLAQKVKIMENKGVLILVLLALLMVILVLGSMMLSGCASDNGQPSDVQGAGASQPAGQGRFGPGMGRNFTGNLTDAQRQQLFEQRMQQAIAACNGKADGDACALQSQRENFTGNCRSLNNTLSCSGGMGSNGMGGGFRGRNRTAGN
jgi:predicted small secreted protein